MSAIEKVNNSGLSVDEKNALKTLMAYNPAIRGQIEEDSTVNDGLLLSYLKGPGKNLRHALLFVVYSLMLINLCSFLLCWAQKKSRIEILLLQKRRKVIIVGFDYYIDKLTHKALFHL